MPSFAIIVPCYNEEKRINVNAFANFVASKSEVCVIFVNDGSNDNTLQLLTQIESINPQQLKIISLPSNKGKAEAVRTGFLAAADQRTYEYIGYLDADLSTSLDEYFSLYQFVRKQNADAVFGSRIKKMGSHIQRSYARHVAGRALATLIDQKFKLGCYDTQCGAKIFKTTVASYFTKNKFLTSWFFDVEILLRLKEAGKFQVVEYPLQQWIDKENSKLSVLSFPLILKEIYVLLTNY